MPAPHDHTPPSPPADSACGHAHHTPGQTDGHNHAEPGTTGHDHAADAHTCSADDHDHAHDAHDAHDEHAGHDHAAGGSCGHSHGFGHAHVHTPASFGKAFAIGIAANSLYLVAEALWGFFSHSLALLADAGHNLSDVLALAAAWMAQHLSQRSPSLRFTYGLRRSSILAALANALVLMLVTGGVAWEAITRLFDPAPVAGKTMMIVAALGIVVNGATALLFAAGQKGDLNIRAAFMHLMADAVTSLAVVIAGGLVLLTGLNWIDPAISLAISVVVVASTWSLLRDSLDMALDAVPRAVDAGAVEGFLRTLPGVADLHDLHIWPISTTETALTVHLVRTNAPMPENDTALLEKAAAALRERFGIVHPTLQIEAADYAHSCALTDPHTV